MSGGSLRFAVPQLIFWALVAWVIRLTLGADIDAIPFRWLMGAWVLGNLADLASTVLFLRTFGAVRCERNETVRWFIDRLGLTGGPVAHKVLFFGPYTLILAQSEWALALFTGVVWYVTANNIRLYLHFRKLVKQVWFAKGLFL